MLDIIDLWPESVPISITNRFPFTLWGDRRNKYIDCADIVVLECMYYKTVLEAYVKGDKFREFSLVRKPLETPVVNGKYKDDGTIRLAYLGSINSLIDIDRISNIVKKLLKIASVEVRIVGKGDNKEKFIDAVKTAGGTPIDYGVIYDNNEKKEIFHDCHFGLNVYKQDVKIGLTTKSVDYIQFGLPMLNTIAGDTEELIDQYGIGINVHRDEMDLNAVLSYVNNRENKREAVLRCFEEKFSAENVEERLRFLDEVI